jgi:23S rRNA U2552 (ribose-2'-O)-methylase RlmE/FtsJ
MASSTHSQAVNKLDEALRISGFVGGCSIGVKMQASIDIGAAPGAWSMFLAGISE